MKGVTVADQIKWLLAKKRLRLTPPDWPPDVFGLAASLLHASGCYAFVVKRWPPHAVPSEEWTKQLKDQAARWRKSCTAPPRVKLLWKRLLVEADRSLSDLRETPDVLDALIELIAIADEASDFFGPTHLHLNDDFARLAQYLLTLSDEEGATLAMAIHPSRLRVLPKFRTPQSGMTIRSLSHYLAISGTKDVKPKWHMVPTLYDQPSQRRMNLLLLPIPLIVYPSQFKAAEPRNGHLLNMPDRFGFFGFTPAEAKDLSTSKLNRIVDQAQKLVGEIDGVILPELAVTPEAYEVIRDELTRRGIFVISGVGVHSSNPDLPGQNYVQFDIPFKSSTARHQAPGQKVPTITDQQPKHHRWQLDRGQIVQYGLGHNLDPSVAWWEHIPLDMRDLIFLTLRDWLTVCILICEDLARQDPISDLVRAVGPNLVIALLMDGPQLASRWPGRYATVLADDPGSSVLTLTSAGMASLSSPPAGIARSRSIALWKDTCNREPISIELPEGASGVVITVSCEYVEEFAADGRSDGRSAGQLTLSGMHPVFVQEEDGSKGGSQGMKRFLRKRNEAAGATIANRNQSC